MTQKLSDYESHALYCPLKNVKSALFVVASFSLISFISWNGLDKSLEHRSLAQLLIVIFVLVVTAQMLAEFTCFRERFLLGLIILSPLTMEVQGFAPSVFRKNAELVKSIKFALDLVGLFVSLTMLVQAARIPNDRRSDAPTSGTPLN
jgi:lysylphosphatidylglycerol synthetase-like protein (DUF2156 family)